MSAPCTLYLVRHGQSVANRDNIVGGFLDTPLTAKGEEQALQTKTLLASTTFATVYSSDLQRAAKTAAIIYGQPVPADHQLVALRERTFGKLEGASAEAWHELDKQYEKQYAHLPLPERWQHNYASFIESDKSLYERFATALQAISRENLGQTVLVGTHGGPVRMLLMMQQYASYLPAGAFQNAGYVVVESDGDHFILKKVVGVRHSDISSE